MGGHPSKAQAPTGSGRLPSGRHGLPRQFVIDNQRRRILGGVMEAVAASGYAAATVGDIITAAQLSRRTFYEHFEGKADCFLAAYDAAVQAAVTATREITSSAESFPEQVRLMLERLVAAVQEHPAWARGCLVEVVAGGDAALARRDEALRLFAETLRSQGERELAGGATVPPLTAELVVSGLFEVITARVVQDRTADLGDEVPQMIYCAVAPYCGHSRAAAFSQPAS